MKSITWTAPTSNRGSSFPPLLDRLLERFDDERIQAFAFAEGLPGQLYSELRLSISPRSTHGDLVDKDPGRPAGRGMPGGQAFRPFDAEADVARAVEGARPDEGSGDVLSAVVPFDHDGPPC